MDSGLKNPQAEEPRLAEQVPIADLYRAEKTKTVFCFRLFHDAPQGAELEDNVRKTVPGQNSKVVIVSEQNPNGGETESLPQFVPSAFSLAGAFHNLKKYYGNNIFFVHADDTNIIALTHMCQRVISERLVSENANPLVLMQEETATRKVYCTAAAALYIFYCSSALRSRAMAQQAAKSAFQNQDAHTFLVAGSWHITDAHRAQTVLNAAAADRGQQIEFTDLYGALIAERRSEETEARKAAEPIFLAIGLAPYSELIQSYRRLAASCTTPELRSKFIESDFSDFVERKITEIAELINKSDIGVSALDEALKKSQEFKSWKPI